MHLFDDTTAQHLLPAHPGSPFCRVCLTEILPDQLVQFRIFIEDLGNLPQLLSMLVIGPEGSQRQLVFTTLTNTATARIFPGILDLLPRWLFEQPISLVVSVLWHENRPWGLEADYTLTQWAARTGTISCSHPPPRQLLYDCRSNARRLSADFAWMITT